MSVIETKREWVGLQGVRVGVRVREGEREERGWGGR